MNQHDYIQAVDEMKIPVSKAFEWANTIIKKYYNQYNETDRQNQEHARDLFDEVAKASERLVDMIPQIQQKLQSDQANSADTLEIFTHILSGPIMTMRDCTKLILALPFWRNEAEQAEDEKEHIRYIQKINSAAEYLSSLDRDVVLKRMLDRLDE
jgi:hypothetical protein